MDKAKSAPDRREPVQIDIHALAGKIARRPVRLAERNVRFDTEKELIEDMVVAAGNATREAIKILAEAPSAA